MKLSQSPVILDWLDREFEEPQLVPEDPKLRAQILTLTNIIACDIHPLNNLRVLKYISGPLGLDADKKQTWYEHWIKEGFEPVERVLSQATGKFCFGDAPTLADCFLIPQIANAQRFKCDMSAYPRAMAVYEHALTQQAFIDAAPANQPDFIA
jgi:maleylacetoacetate isomerase